MLVGVFKSNQKIVNGLVFLLTIMLWLPSFFIDKGSQLPTLIFTSFSWLDVVLAILLISCQAIYINTIVNEYKLVENNTHLTSLIFVLLNSCSFMLFNLNQVVIANSFLLLGLHQLLKFYDAKGGFALPFNASFLISIATVIYLPNVVFLLLLWMALIYMVTPKWRDFAVTLIGFSIPIIYVVSYRFVFENITLFNWHINTEQIFNVKWNTLTVLNKTVFFMVLALVPFALIKLTTNLNRGAVRTQKMLVVVVLILVVGLASLFLNKFDYLATFVVLTIPLSIIIAVFFNELKKQWLAEAIFLLLLVAIVLSYFL